MIHIPIPWFYHYSMPILPLPGAKEPGIYTAKVRLSLKSNILPDQSKRLEAILTSSDVPPWYRFEQDGNSFE